MSLDLSLFTDFIAAHRAWALPIIFLVSFAESFAFVSLLIPGTAILLATGALVPSGTLTIWPLITGAVLGAVLGDSVSYWLGRRYGDAILRQWPFTRYPELVARGQAFVARHGMASIAIGRFSGPVRAVTPLLAGMGRMDRRQFWVANVGSALVWAPVMLLPGALLGWAADGASTAERWMLVGAAVAVAIVALVVQWRRRAAAP